MFEAIEQAIKQLQKVQEMIGEVMEGPAIEATLGSTNYCLVNRILGLLIYQPIFKPKFKMP
ncbi:hypothetical protein [Weissella ceti]|uniref:hypothetical protein n=1 Tax=Weissella ceti TaxID=759620 RepID=UPI001184C41A|nr:hypothetical protein [Weissella ceti]